MSGKPAYASPVALPAYLALGFIALLFAFGIAVGSLFVRTGHDLGRLSIATMTFVSTLAPVLTALYAKRQIDLNGELERLKATMSVL